MGKGFDENNNKAKGSGTGRHDRARGGGKGLGEGLLVGGCGNRWAGCEGGRRKFDSVMTAVP